MTKDVLISISGLHYDTMDDSDEGQPVEVVTPATYYLKNEKHYVVYDEMVEGFSGVIKNTIKISGDNLFEIRKSGIADTHMVFEKDRINMTSYATPYGDMMVGIHTKDMEVLVKDEEIKVKIQYALDVNNEPLSDCEINVHIKELKKRN